MVAVMATAGTVIADMDMAIAAPIIVRSIMEAIAAASFAIGFTIMAGAMSVVPCASAAAITRRRKMG